MPALAAAFWYMRQIWSYDQGKPPSWTGDAKIQSSGSENGVVCFQFFKASNSSAA